MATRIHRETRNVEQTKKVIPFISWETSFGWNVCKLVFGVNKLYLDLEFQIDPVKQPIKSNSVGSGHVSHHWTLSFNYHFDHGFVVFKNVQPRFTLRRMGVRGYIIHFTQLLNLLLSFDILGLGFGIVRVAPVFWKLVCLVWTVLLIKHSTSMTMFQRSRAGNPSIRNSASREIISDNVELCDIQLIGTNVLLPKIHKTPPVVDFESSRSPAKS